MSKPKPHLVPSPEPASSPPVASADASDAAPPPATAAEPALPPAPPAAPPHDPFDPEYIRLSQDFAATPVKHVLASIGIHKPSRQEFIRVHPTLQLATTVLELKEEREFYLVDPALRAVLGNEITPRLLVLAVTRAGVPFLWPLRTAGEDGKLDRWSSSARAAAQRAVSTWIRVRANPAAGSYEWDEALRDLGPPQFPSLAMHEILKLAFREHHIGALDHPVVMKLRGEV